MSLTLVGAVAPGWDKRLRLDQAGVRVTGPVSRRRVIEELQRASVFVLASVDDGFGMVIAQAMACGMPVIATEGNRDPGAGYRWCGGDRGSCSSGRPVSPRRSTPCCRIPTESGDGRSCLAQS